MWFKKAGWLYKPANIFGWVLMVVAVVFLYSVYTTYNAHAHGFGDLSYKIYPHYVSTFLLYLWVGSRTSK